MSRFKKYKTSIYFMLKHLKFINSKMCSTRLSKYLGKFLLFWQFSNIEKNIFKLKKKRQC